MARPMRIAVAGATGRVGRHVAEVLGAAGHEVVAMSRGSGVDLVSGEGLAAALAGVEAIIDTATGSSPEREAATGFFTASTRNLHEAGERAGVRQIVVVSIIGIDDLAGGYSLAKLAHEQASLAGPVPAQILRSSQFHEFVPQLMQWGTQGDVIHVPRMRTQLVAARTVAEALVRLAAGPTPSPEVSRAPFAEIAGPREESLVEAATVYAKRTGNPRRVEGVSDPSNPDAEADETGGLLPGPHAVLTGPTFAEWLDARS
jgi:uncharacterized protein YbjT (DUF2867 family)